MKTQSERNAHSCSRSGSGDVARSIGALAGVIPVDRRRAADFGLRLHRRRNADPVGTTRHLDLRLVRSPGPSAALGDWQTVASHKITDEKPGYP